MDYMICPKCKSENVTIQMLQIGSKSSHKSGGCLWVIGIMFLIICTCGLWLIIGKHKGGSKTKITNKKIAICQDCAYQWKV